MSRKAGALLWNRMQITVPPAVNGGPPGTLDVDTGLTQVNKSFPDMSPGEPNFGNPSRIQVIPLAPTLPWMNITHGEPTFNATTNTIHVTFSNPQPVAAQLNVLFWNPHSLVGPGDADNYTIL
jgi:hypothetical protein